MVNSTLIIIAFPFAGGNKYSFKEFLHIPDFVVLEYPGRSQRANERLLTTIDLIIEDLLCKVKDEVDFCDDYVIYGHSMGALVGYLICHKIEELGIRKPIKLIVSGKKPPTVEKEKLLFHLPDHLFWEEVVKMGGIPDEFSNHPELMNFYIPILKADFKAVEQYNHTKKEKLTIPIDVFYGTDEEITEDEIIRWENESTKKVTLRQLEGDHFFIYKHKAFFINYFKNVFEELTY